MVVTLCLIAINSYNSVDAPKTRQFSYIEVWMIGVQIPIIISILEYGLIIGLQRFSVKFQIQSAAIYKQLDMLALFGTFAFFSSFNLWYWTHGDRLDHNIV